MTTNGKPLWGTDTETTGLDVWHGCRPFFVSSCSEEGVIKFWEWDVDPFTREPIIPKEEAREVREHINGERHVFHNTKFDARMLDRAGLGKIDFANVQDTLIASHVLASGESHALKDLCLQYLDIDDDDQQELKDAVNEARRIARREDWGWRLAGPEDPHFPAMKRSPKAGWGVMDMWLPRAVAKKLDLPEDHIFWNVCKRYAILDAERTIGLWLMQREALEEEGLYGLYETRRKTLGVTYRMEERGVTVDRRRVESGISKYTEEAARSEKLCYRFADHSIDNLRSNKQLQGVLYGHFGLTTEKKTKQGYSTDAETIRSLLSGQSPRTKAYQFLKHLQNTRKFSKAVDYLTSYKDFGVAIKGCDDWFTIHASFNETGTATTRLSSSNPNAQNISKQDDFNLREVFGPMPGRVWYSIDYENIELRIFAYESGDKNLIKAFEDGYSVHLIIAELLHPKEFAECGGGEAFKKKYKATLYQWVKNGNFSLIYGASPRKADATYRVPGAYDRIRKNLPLIDKFISRQSNDARTKGYVTTLGGYRLQVPRGEPHKAANYFVQGSAGWAMVLALVRCDEYLRGINADIGRDEYYMNMTIHDELDFDFPARKGNTPKIRRIKQLMEQSGDDLGLPTPVDVEIIKKTWANGEGLSLAT